MRRPLARARMYFLAGLAVTAPLAITVWLTAKFVLWVDGLVLPLLPAGLSDLTHGVPGFGLVIAVMFLTLSGLLAANYVGQSVVRQWQRVLSRMPVARNIHNGLKQMLETLFSADGGNFRRVGLVEFPRKGVWALALVAGEAGGELKAAAGEGEWLALFVPTTPNPTTGFLVVVRHDEVTPLEMGIEDAARLVISAGLVAPELPPGRDVDD